jgi:hypothetical protein
MRKEIDCTLKIVIESTNGVRSAPALGGRGNAAFVSWLHLGMVELAAISSYPARRCQFKRQTSRNSCAMVNDESSMRGY